MKISSLSELKKDLHVLEADELRELVLRLAKHSKENKELLHYQLFESDYESAYIDKLKEDISQQFQELDQRNLRNSKKGLQKMVRNLKKFLKYSGKKTTEIEVLIHFCVQLQASKIPFKRHLVLHNLFIRQVKAIQKAISTLDEDLQHDYTQELEVLLVDLD